MWASGCTAVLCCVRDASVPGIPGPGLGDVGAVAGPAVPCGQTVESGDVL